MSPTRQKKFLVKLRRTKVHSYTRTYMDIYTCILHTYNVYGHMYICVDITYVRTRAYTYMCNTYTYMYILMTKILQNNYVLLTYINNSMRTKKKKRNK